LNASREMRRAVKPDSDISAGARIAADLGVTGGLTSCCVTRNRSDEIGHGTIVDLALVVSDETIPATNSRVAVGFA